MLCEMVFPKEYDNIRKVIRNLCFNARTNQQDYYAVFQGVIVIAKPDSNDCNLIERWNYEKSIQDKLGDESFLFRNDKTKLQHLVSCAVEYETFQRIGVFLQVKAKKTKTSITEVCKEYIFSLGNMLFFSKDDVQEIARLLGNYWVHGSVFFELYERYKYEIYKENIQKKK